MNLNQKETKSLSNNPIVSAIAKTMSLFRESERIVCHDEISSRADIRILSYYDDFELLWGITENNVSGCPRFFDKSHHSTHIIVVWDGIPKSTERCMFSDKNIYLFHCIVQFAQSFSRIKIIIHGFLKAASQGVYSIF